MQSTFAHKHPIKAAAAMAVMATLSTQAHALDLINTQPPTSGAGLNEISSVSWLADKFVVSGPMLINSIEAFVTSNDSGNDAGKTFTLALYSDSGLNLPALDWNSASHGQLAQAEVTYNVDGWNGVSGLNWSLGQGNYWLAIEQYGSGNEANSLLAPTSATPSALAVAFYDGVSYRATGLSDTFGLRITATPAVPEASSISLALVSLGLIGVVARRRRA
jgi:hypothetical protein